MTSPFQLHRPQTVVEASTLMNEIGDEATLYCGGTELLLLMKMGLTSFGHLIDVKGIGELQGIRADADGSLRIGAAVTHREIERSPLIAAQLPSLARLEHQVANVRVRNTGSLGGNLCFAEPHSDPAVLLVAADAVLTLRSAEHARTVSVEDFIIGPLTTDRQPDEVLIDVVVPPAPANTYMVYEKLAFHERPAASVAVRLTLASGGVEAAAIVIGSVGERPMRVVQAASILVRELNARSTSAVASASEAAAKGCEAFADLNGSEEYKRHLVDVLTRRALNGVIHAAGLGS